MKFATWINKGTEESGIISEDMLSIHSFREAGLAYSTLLDFILSHNSADMECLKQLSSISGQSIDDVKLIAPIPRPHHDIICLGLNYDEHLNESTSFLDSEQERPASIYFSKRVNCAVGPDGEIQSHNDIESRLDYEAELAVIMGRTAKKVSRESAWDYVFGVCCFNDISARDLQYNHKQWYFGKSLDTFTVFGPYIVTMDEFALPLKLGIRCYVNGELRQNSDTSKMIYSIPEIISELSSGMTIDIGSIIATGTPSGVGAAFSPERCLKPGDICEMQIDGCGSLRNVVV